VHGGVAEPAVAPDPNRRVRPDRSQPRDPILPVVVGSPGSRRGALPQAEQRRFGQCRRRDDQRQGLVLLGEAGEEGPILFAAGRVIDRIEVEGYRDRRLSERGDERVDEDVAPPFPGGDVDLVLEAEQGGLTGQSRASGDLRNQLEDGVGSQGVVSVLVLDLTRMPKTRIRVRSRNECSMRSGSRGSSRAVVNGRASRSFASSCRRGNNPTADVSGTEEKSVQIGWVGSMKSEPTVGTVGRLMNRLASGQ
jgi:hypothetical protein